MRLPDFAPGLRCPACGAGLAPPAAPGAEGGTTVCAACGTKLRIVARAGGRTLRRAAAEVPAIIATLAGLIVVWWLFAEPRKSPVLTGAVILALAAGFLPALFLAETLKQRMLYRVAGPDPGSSGRKGGE